MNSTLPSLQAFSQLECIRASEQRVSYDSQLYAVLVLGLLSYAEVHLGSRVYPGNNELLDIGRVLDLAAASSLAVYVAQNTKLCLQPPVYWGRREDSYLEYQLLEVLTHVVIS